MYHGHISSFCSFLLRAVDAILRRSTQVVEEKFFSEGYTALHIAATNDFVEVMSLLLDLVRDALLLILSETICSKSLR